MSISRRSVTYHSVALLFKKIKLMIDIIKNRLSNLIKQKNIVLSEFHNPDNINSDFIIVKSKVLLEIENRITELRTLLLIEQNKQ